ncbi:MAG: DUF4835 family protein [Thermonemataceae bacterium]
MSLVKKLWVSVAILCGCYPLSAQELNCQVIVVDQQIQTAQATERQIFRQMEQTISEFMNTRKWTDDNFDEEEKINCKIEITLLTGSLTTGDYEGTAQITATRPVYNTTYESPMFLFVDRNFSFNYVQAQPLDFNDNVFFGDLSAMLGFYAYVIIGIDYDSFAENGGIEYIEKAFNVSSTAQSTSANPAWQRGDSRNRYWLIENLMSQQMASFREGLYKYHRLSLDTYTVEKAKAHENMLAFLKDLATINRLKPSSVLINSFLDAKAEELVGIFSTAEDPIKQAARDILVKIDPGKTARYNRITQIRGN